MNKSRFLIAISILNAMLALPHVWPQTATTFGYVRTGMALARTFHGVLEFSAFVISAFTGGSEGTVMYVVLLVLVPLSVYLLWDRWKEGGDARFFLSLLIAANMLFGLAAVWAGSLPVKESARCSSEQDDHELRVVEYTELGWLPRVHYFVSVWDKSRGSGYELASRTVQNPVPEPCANIRSIFPDLEELLDA